MVEGLSNPVPAILYVMRGAMLPLPAGRALTAMLPGPDSPGKVLRQVRQHAACTLPRSPSCTTRSTMDTSNGSRVAFV